MPKKQRMADKVCNANGCNNLVGAHGAKGLCPKHYRQYKHDGKLPLKEGETRQRCRVVGCKRWAEVTGLCQAHYYRRKRTGDFGTADIRPNIKRPPVCTVAGCGRKHYSRGYCRMHYGRWYHGAEDIEHTVRPLISNLISEYKAEYDVWQGIKARCNNPNHKGYRNYGGRGIRVCDRWMEKPYGFKNFLEDMGPRPKGEYPSGFARYSIDRIDVNGPYSPDNCRWTTRYIQAANTRLGPRGDSRTIGVWQVHAKYGDYWVATIGVDGEHIIEWAKSEEEAVAKRKELERKYLGKELKPNP